MTDNKNKDLQQELKSSDPAQSSPAEGQSHPIPAADKGTGTQGIDTGARAEPAEGGRDEA